MDVGHEATEKLLTELETKLANEYAIAVHDVQEKLAAYLQETEEGRKKQEDLLKAGEISKKEYSDWVYRHTMVGKRWSEMRDTLAADLSHANEIAMGIIKGTMPDVFALNANYGTFQVEQSGKIDTGFTLYNHDTAAYLLGDQRQLMPKPSAWKEQQIAANKDMQWNKEKIQSAVLQGVLQGESPHKVADRLMQVGQMDYNAAVRYARTMTTSAQNAGRYESYRRAESLGVELVIEWEATLDGRTRHEHRLMHGMRTTVDEPFETPDGYTIYYPADCSGASDAPQEEIWNCRCTLLAWVKGFEGETVTSSPAMGDMSFEEWQGAKKDNTDQQQPETPAAPTQYKSSDCTVRKEKFKFEDGTWTGVRKEANANIYTTPDGLEIVFPSTYNKANITLTVDELLEAYSKIPPEVASKGQKRIIVNDVYNPQDAYWRKHYKNFGHSYMTGGDTINIWRYNYKHDIDYLAQSLSHEIGHGIDRNVVGYVGQRFSSGTEWAAAMAADLAASGKKSPTSYGENASVEDFAESVAYYSFHNAELQKDFPNRYSAIVDLLFNNKVR